MVSETDQLKEDYTQSNLIMESLPLLENVYQNGLVFFSVASVEHCKVGACNCGYKTDPSGKHDAEMCIGYGLLA